MSTGEARRSQSAISFNIVKKHGEISNKRPDKRLGGDIEDLTPEILVSQASTSTITDESDNTNPNLLTARPPRSNNTDALAIKLNRLREKSARYNSHKDFLSRCIQEKLVHEGLELNLEPKIGNYDQEFIDNWHSNLKDFSRILLKQIVAFCEKTEEKTQTNITEIEVTLKQQLKKDDYAEIQSTVKVNETATKQIFHQRKFKKFNTLKYKPKLTIKTTNFTEGNELLEISPTTGRPSYAEILKDAKNSSVKTSKTSLDNYKTNKNIHGKLRSLSPTIQTRKQGNIPLRNNSNTNMAKDDKYQQEINELKEEIKC